MWPERQLTNTNNIQGQRTVWKGLSQPKGILSQCVKCGVLAKRHYIKIVACIHIRPLLLLFVHSVLHLCNDPRNGPIPLMGEHCCRRQHYGQNPSYIKRIIFWCKAPNDQRFIRLISGKLDNRVSPSIG